MADERHDGTCERIGCGAPATFHVAVMRIGSDQPACAQVCDEHLDDVALGMAGHLILAEHRKEGH